jgi:hypothetical protein
VTSKCIGKETQGPAGPVVLERGMGFARDDVRDVFQGQRLGPSSGAEGAGVTSINSIREPERSKVASDLGILEQLT